MISADRGFSVQVVNSVPEILALREDWQNMARDPNGDIDFYLTVIEVNSKNASPHVIVLRRDGTVRAILAGRIEQKPLDVPLGYRKLSTAPLRFLTLIHGGVLGEDREEYASLLVSAVWDTLKRHDVDVACFHGVDDDTALYREARKAGWLLTRDLFPVSLPRWRLKLAATYEQVVQRRSANTRHNLKRYSKRFEKTFGNQFEIRSFREGDDLEEMLADTELIARKTYVRGLGVGFVPDEQTRRISSLAANKGWLRAQILYLKGEPCAFWNGFLYRRTFFTWTTGYQPHLAEFRPGMYLLQKLLEELCNEGSTDEVDFGFGDAQYKRDVCDHEKLQAAVLLFAPSAKGIALNSLRTPLIYATNTARSLLVRTGLQQKIKKAWRRRVTGTASTPSSNG